MRERLELVTDWASLRVGDYIELRDCLDCGGSHRGILTGRCDGDRRVDWSLVPARQGWAFLPAAPCEEYDVPFSWFGPGAVSGRFLYRIDTGLEGSISTPTRKKRSVRA